MRDLLACGLAFTVLSLAPAQAQQQPAPSGQSETRARGFVKIPALSGANFQSEIGGQNQGYLNPIGPGPSAPAEHQVRPGVTAAGPVAQVPTRAAGGEDAAKDDDRVPGAGAHP